LLLLLPLLLLLLLILMLQLLYPLFQLDKSVAEELEHTEMLVVDRQALLAAGGLVLAQMSELRGIEANSNSLAELRRNHLAVAADVAAAVASILDQVGPAMSLP